ncbi:hypothetical protein BBB56_12360 [Candidatus Pantoea deserta]|uniref:Uncharacterized protein n=1 Tax=Candidatus Pantoea deserta TaxID=1869313 RepID=A0A3N4P1R7_9GAMM|nr:hypothetical protein BBB56_12360 [Pantoea deserta]
MNSPLVTHTQLSIDHDSGKEVKGALYAWLAPALTRTATGAAELRFACSPQYFLTMNAGVNGETALSENVSR